MNPRSQVLDINSILKILPHQPPAVLLDRVIEVEPGDRILVSKNLAMSDPAFHGHFPGLPMLPGTVLLEAMVQACCLLVYATEPYEPAKHTVMLLGVNKCKFRRSLRPGQVVEIEAALEKRRSNVWRFAVKAFVDDHHVAEGELAVSIQDRESTI